MSILTKEQHRKLREQLDRKEQDTLKKDVRQADFEVGQQRHLMMPSLPNPNKPG